MTDAFKCYYTNQLNPTHKSLLTPTHGSIQHGWTQPMAAVLDPNMGFLGLTFFCDTFCCLLTLF